MNRILRALSALATCVLSLAAYAFQGPLAVPPPTVDDPAHSPMFSVQHVGGRVVAVGRWGVIAVGDGATRWRQAKVDVSTDLVDVCFGSELDGWAVGHGGVVLHTSDGGATWGRQLDGRQAGALALDYYRKTAAQLPVDQRDDVLRQAERWAQEGSSQPFLGVWFKNAKTGFIVGSFGRIFRTDDGGENWKPLVNRIDNPQELHLYAISGRGDEVYIVGEGGKVWRWETTASRFVNVPTPYNGSLFGALLAPQSVMVFGMRGNVFRSTDHGANWQHIPTGIKGGIVSGDVRANGDIVLVSQSGETLVSTDGGITFIQDGGGNHTPVADIAVLPDGRRVTVGSNGIKFEQGPDSVSQHR